ncbi:uncharacterized protein LOC114842746 isoform X1 [Betta splendens]|uniref:Uncharacterized protein LOC114842746 isoform X1 n=1 Tax=Betta splendens TaxID=158456 RepID=A0A6P7KPM2_BETSP|nr:uncharacterized protein LOC114842746 isoform X1 [Betta splendens]
MDSRQILWSVMVLLSGQAEPEDSGINSIPPCLDPGAVGQSVKYPDPVCAVRGSTVTLPCTFTSLQSTTNDNTKYILQVVRVRWCQNHGICQGTTPSVYDSNNQNNNSRYQYLGNLKENCTLRIRDVQKTDDAVLRFRMEVNHTSGHFTEPSGVRVTVIEPSELRINRSSTDLETVTLFCTSACTFRPPEVTWFKDDRALSVSEPALQLGAPTAKDAGNYSCAFKTNSNIHSQPFLLTLDKEPTGNGVLLVTAAVVLGVLLPLSSVLLICFICRRKSAAVKKDQRSEREQSDQQLPDNIYSSILPPSGPDGRVEPQKTHQAMDEVDYASIQIMHMKRTRREKEADDAVVYTCVATRG